MITDKDDPVTTPIERFRRIIPNALTEYGLFALNTEDPTPRLVLNTSFLPKITEKGSGARTFVVRTVPRETVRTAMYLIRRRKSIIRRRKFIGPGCAFDFRGL